MFQILNPPSMPLSPELDLVTLTTAVILKLMCPCLGKVDAADYMMKSGLLGILQLHKYPTPVPSLPSLSFSPIHKVGCPESSPENGYCKGVWNFSTLYLSFYHF